MTGCRYLFARIAEPPTCTELTASLVIANGVLSNIGLVHYSEH